MLRAANPTRQRESQVLRWEPHQQTFAEAAMRMFARAPRMTERLIALPMMALWKPVIAGLDRLIALPSRVLVGLHRVRTDPAHSAAIPLPPASPSFAKHFPPSCPPLQSAIKQSCSAPIKFAIVLCYSCYCSDGNIARLRKGCESIMASSANIRFAVQNAGEVSAILLRPQGAESLLVLAH